MGIVQVYPVIPLVQLASLLPGALIVSAIVMPFQGVLVRYRANYNRRNVQMALDGEGGQVMANHSGPPVYGYFAMMRRVYRLEGMSGFYKGFMPTFLGSFCFALVFTLFGRSPIIFKPLNTVASALDILGFLIFLLVTFVFGLPLQILTNRAIVIPYRLPSFDLRKSLRVLLSPDEYRRPWMLYHTPGLLISIGLQFLITVLSLSGVMFMLPSLTKMFNRSVSNSSAVTLIVVAITLSWSALCSTALAPLEVITVRLMIQRNHSVGHGVGIDNSDLRTQVEEAEAEGLKEWSTEDVIALRDEQDPYLGLVDCASSIVREEGYRVLFRAWWVTVLGHCTF